jgi:hypothetical protein
VLLPGGLATRGLHLHVAARSFERPFAREGSTVAGIVRRRDRRFTIGTHVII